MLNMHFITLIFIILRWQQQYIIHVTFYRCTWFTRKLKKIYKFVKTEKFKKDKTCKKQSAWQTKKFMWVL